MKVVVPVQHQNSGPKSDQTSIRQLQVGAVTKSESIDMRSHATQLQARQLLAQSSPQALQLKALADVTKRAESRSAPTSTKQFAKRSTDQHSNGLTNVAHLGKGEIQLKKDKAVDVFNDGESGVSTATKVIDPKDGSRGLFKYAYGSGNIIDSFNGKNIANPKIADGTKYAGLTAPNITVKVAAHDLTADYGDGALTKSEVTSGGRPLHFRHADNAHKIDRTDKYTWHHLQTMGKMELIDMNVHGAMWHYGGISGWAASLHNSDAGDDDPSA
ncbi:HNH endonuclease signature motif containing protein [Undibacterium flavidum]|uniref:HNH endonuclease n=1 Tax=Undibacterium flavidum TaxID=2762297 RepID=A0ABR6Y7U1_9BURK|nr:HNH endonuclease [Undibacterium flavidum]MBC3872672.1 HNH endonuclease [Undibacterium flavidum]